MLIKRESYLIFKWNKILTRRFKMDIPYGSNDAYAFITNVGLVTSEGPFGANIMACEWTHMVSYSPGMIVVCVGPNKATAANIRATKEFGVNIASTEQNVLSSLSGTTTGKEIDKISALKELGFKFYDAKKIKAPMVEGAVLTVECALIKEIPLGDHIMFVGEALEVKSNPDKKPLAYNRGQYGQVVLNIQKPSPEERERMRAVLEKHSKKENL